MSNEARLRALCAAIDDEGPADGIHNEEVRELFAGGGRCPRYLGCTSEGTGESTYRDNPDFFAGDLREVAQWLGSSFAEGWAANWVCDLDHPRAPGGEAHLDWSVLVQLPAATTTPTVLDSKDLLLAANQVLVEQRKSPAFAEVVEARHRGRQPQPRPLPGRTAPDPRADRRHCRRRLRAMSGARPLAGAFNSKEVKAFGHAGEVHCGVEEAVRGARPRTHRRRHL